MNDTVPFAIFAYNQFNITLIPQHFSLTLFIIS